MPTYDYVCDACQHEFELYQSIKEDAKKKCPACKKSKLRRKFGTGAAIVFKGSGFYQTDYRSDSYKKDAAAEKKSSGETKKKSDAATGDSTKGDSKTGGARESGSSKSSD
jgi:putative FmdB family regulatory protein